MTTHSKRQVITMASIRHADTSVCLPLWIFNTLFCILATGALPACRPLARPKQLTVQTFIVTKGRENITLGLVSISAAPSEVVRTAIRKHLENTALLTADSYRRLARLGEERTALADKRKALVDKSRVLFEELTDLRSQCATMEMAIIRHKGPITALDITGGMDSARQAIAGAADEALRRSRSAMQQEEAAPLFKDFERLNNLVKQINDLAADAHDRSLPVKQTLERLKTFYANDAMRQFPKEQQDVCDALDRLTNILGKEDIDALREKAGALDKQISEQHERLKEMEAEIRTDVDLVLAGLDERRASLMKEIKDHEDLECFWDSLPPPHISRKTDSNGVAVLELDSRVCWTLWAATERDLLNAEEHYYWLVETPPPATWNPQSPLLLSNDNQITSIYEAVSE